MTHSYAYNRRVDALIRLALDEDLPNGDLTTEAVIEGDTAASARIEAGEGLVVSGLGVAARLFELLDPDCSWAAECGDGDRLEEGGILARIAGKASTLLAGERTALNFLQHLSGIATSTRRTAKMLEGTGVVLLDTRKTLPGWRLLEKEAVRHGGGTNHRFNLSDSVLIKDNHIRLAGGVAAALGKARTNLPVRTRIEIEVTSEAELTDALRAGADVILADNLPADELRRFVELAGEDAVIEASGGIDEENCRDFAATGVSMISMGALTHSARSVDIRLEIE